MPDEEATLPPALLAALTDPATLAAAPDTAALYKDLPPAGRRIMKRIQREMRRAQRVAGSSMPSIPGIQPGADMADFLRQFAALAMLFTRDADLIAQLRAALPRILSEDEKQDVRALLATLQRRTGGDINQYLPPELAPLFADVAREVELTPEQAERAEERRKVTAIKPGDTVPALNVPIYTESEAVRTAALNHSGWTREPGGTAVYPHDNGINVYLYVDGKPLPYDEAIGELAEMSPAAVLTLRILEGIYQLHKHNPERLNKRGRVAFSYAEIAHWRNIGKRAKDGYSNGYRPEVITGIIEDVRRAGMFYVRGLHTIYIDKPGRGRRGGWQKIAISDNYLHIAPVQVPNIWGEMVPVGGYLVPGEWYTDGDTGYAGYHNFYYRQVNRAVFSLDPQNEQHELRIALYLMERWRMHWKSGRYRDPLPMRQLLAESCITVNTHNMLRFADRIEDALHNLQQVRPVGLNATAIAGVCECLDPVDRGRARWGQAWLDARWRILPPEDIAEPNALPEPIAETQQNMAKNDARNARHVDGGSVRRQLPAPHSSRRGAQS